jgi:hypothetical protein
MDVILHAALRLLASCLGFGLLLSLNALRSVLLELLVLGADLLLSMLRLAATASTVRSKD